MYRGVGSLSLCKGHWNEPYVWNSKVWASVMKTLVEKTREEAFKEAAEYIRKCLTCINPKERQGFLLRLTMEAIAKDIERL